MHLADKENPHYHYTQNDRKRRVCKPDVHPWDTSLLCNTRIIVWVIPKEQKDNNMRIISPSKIFALVLVLSVSFAEGEDFIRARDYASSLSLEVRNVLRFRTVVCWENMLNRCNTCHDSNCDFDGRCINDQCLVLVEDGRESCLDTTFTTTPPANICSRCLGSGECSSSECVNGTCMRQYEPGKYVCVGDI